MKSHFLAWNWKTGFSIGVLEQRSKDYRLQTDGKDSQLFLAWNWKTGFSIEALAPNTKDSLNPARAIKQGLQTTDRRQGFSALLYSVLAAHRISCTCFFFSLVEFSSLKPKNWFLYWSVGAEHQGFSQPCSRDQARTTDYRQTARILSFVVQCPGCSASQAEGETSAGNSTQL